MFFHSPFLGFSHSFYLYPSMRQTISFEISDPDFQERLLLWSNKQTVSCALNSNREKQLFSDEYSKLDFIVAVEAIDQITGPTSGNTDGFKLLKDFHDSRKDWLFGFLTYDLKNDPGHPGEKLKSENFDGLGFPLMHFFQPRFIFELSVINRKLDVRYLEKADTVVSVQQIVDDISAIEIREEEEFDIQMQPRVSKEEYTATVSKIKEHIQRGDVYELNYCLEFFANDTFLNPVHCYKRLNELSPMPFSTFYKLNEHYLMCASPERFVAKRKSAVISQPMKGTARRGANPEEDVNIKSQLQNDFKEQSENVMIVDLVRNDLSRTAKKGSVEVKELFGVYAFKQLHQMISTVVSEVKEDVHFVDVIKNLFPMGSMTGAPKVRAMQLIEEFENTKRGLYSGTVGYVTPDDDFDFNVVIRSVLYNERKKYLSFMVGSAITANSTIENEYDECLLKAGAMLNVLRSNRSLVTTGC